MQARKNRETEARRNSVINEKKREKNGVQKMGH